MQFQNILLAGASGYAGKYLVPLLLEQGYKLRLLTRSKSRLERNMQGMNIQGMNMHNVEIIEADITDITNAASLKEACKGIDAVISSVGASLDLNNFSDRRTFHDVDYCGNLNLLQAAKTSGIQKFIYVSAFGGETTDTAYTNAHENFVKELQQSSLKYSVVRPTGFFYINASFVEMARRGAGMVIGDGKALTNPIHEQDVAKTCLHALEGSQNDVPCGGAETFTREEIVRLAFEAVGKKPRLVHIPFGMMIAGSKLTSLFNPRLGQMFAFGSVVATKDCVAPAVQTEHRLKDYFGSVAKNIAADK